MPTTDEMVLEYIGLDGRSQQDVLGRFPAFDVTRLLRARLVALADQRGDTEAHIFDASRKRYFLTRRGAEALGVGKERVRD